MVENLPVRHETRVQSLGWEVPLEKEMEIHSSILSWKIPWTEKPGGLHSLGCKESDMTEQLNTVLARLKVIGETILITFYVKAYLFFCLFILFMGFSRQEYWRLAICFSSGPQSVRTLHLHPSWVALHGMAHNFIELEGFFHVISLISFLWLWFSFCCPLMDKDNRLMETSWWERKMRKLVLFWSVGQAQ